MSPCVPAADDDAGFAEVPTLIADAADLTLPVLSTENFDVPLTWASISCFVPRTGSGFGGVDEKCGVASGAGLIDRRGDGDAGLCCSTGPQ